MAKKNALVILLLSVILLKGAVWATVFPLFQAPDEQAHFSYVQYWAENHEIPRPPFEEEGKDISKQLKYALGSLEFEELKFNPLYRQSFSDTGVVGPLETRIEQTSQDPKPTHDYLAYSYPPLYYALNLPIYWIFGNNILNQVMGMRFLSVLISMIMMGLIYRAAQQVFEDKRMALTGTALVAFQPMVSYFSAVINNDVLLNVAYAGFFYTSLKALNQSGRLKKRQTMELGFWILLGILAKTQGYALIALFFLLFLFKKGFNVQKKWINKGVGMATVVITLFLGYELFFQNMVDRLKAYAQFFQNHTFGELITNSWFYWQTIFESFWGRFGWLDTLMPTFYFNIVKILVLVTGVGLVHYLYRNWGKSKKEQFLLWAAILIIGIYFFYFLDSTLREGALVQDRANQGRYFFIILIPLVVLGLRGFTHFFSKKAKILSVWGLLMVSVIFHFMALTTVIIPRYYAGESGPATENQIYVLNPQQTVEESFTATEDGLQEIRLLVGTSNQKLRGTFSVMGPDGSTVESGEFKLRINQNTLIIPLDPIENSKDRQYQLILQGDAENPSKIGLLKAIESDSLVFKLDYENQESVVQNTATILNRMSQYKTWWSKRPYLEIYWALFTITTAGLLVLMLKKGFENPHESV